MGECPEDECVTAAQGLLAFMDYEDAVDRTRALRMSVLELVCRSDIAPGLTPADALVLAQNAAHWVETGEFPQGKAGDLHVLEGGR